MSDDGLGPLYEPSLSRCGVPGCGRTIWWVAGGWIHGYSDEPPDGHEATKRAPMAGGIDERGSDGR